MGALWMEVCLAFPATDALREGSEVPQSGIIYRLISDDDELEVLAGEDEENNEAQEIEERKTTLHGPIVNL